MSKLLPYMPVIAADAHRFSRALAVSANADILLYYFGWVLRVPWLGRWVLRLPFIPRLANFLCMRLPRWPVRGRTAHYICEVCRCADVPPSAPPPCLRAAMPTVPAAPTASSGLHTPAFPSPPHASRWG